MPIVDHRTSLYDGQLEFVWKRLKIQSTFWDAFNRSFGLRPKLPADANIVGLTSMSAGKDSYRVFRMKNSQFKNWQGRQFLNCIRAATAKDVSGKKPCRRFCSAKTRSSKIGTGRRSIYNICIMNYCKLTFEFFKNYIFEKRRQFLNRILGRNQFLPRKAGR